MTSALRMTLSLALVLSFVALARADQERSPAAYVVAADGGRYYLKLEPTGAKRWARPYAGRGSVYRVVAGGRDQRVWTMTGWWAFETHLSYDGEYVVRIGDWPRGHNPSDQHLAIAFYKRGALLARYSTKQLIKDPTKVRPSKSHYRFKRKVHGFASWSYRFSMTAIDGVTYDFDARTGKILATR